MRARGPVLAGLVLAGLALAGAVAWPSIEAAAKRSIEDRLRAETGRPWRIEGVALALRPGPLLVLRNIAVGDDRAESGVFGARIREVRLADPVSLLLGSGTSGRAEAEGLSLRSPLPGKTGQEAGGTPETKDASPGPSSGKAAAIRLFVRGADAALAESGRALTASAKSLELVFDLAAPQDRTEIRASVELPSATASLTFERPVSGGEPGPLSFTLEPREGGGHRVEARATASLTAAVLKLDAVSGTIDASPFGGSLEIGWGGPRPRIALDARLDALILTDAENAARRDAKDGLVVPVTPDIVPDVRWFSGFDGTGQVSFGRLDLGPVRSAKVALAGNVKDGSLDANLTASAYEGGARGRYVLAPESDGTGRHQLGFSLNKLRVLPLLSDLAGLRGIDGTGTLRVDLQAKGSEIDTVRRSLSGTADLTVSEGRIEGLDLAGAIGLIPQGGRDGAGRGSLGTRLDRLAGAFSLSEGQAVTNDLLVKTALIEAKGIGSLDLIGRTLDIRLKPQVIAPGAGRPGGRNPLDVPVRIVGPWNNPSVSADLSGLAENPAGAIEQLQDLGKGILGDENIDLGDALGGLLDGLLGKPERGRPRAPGEERELPR